MRKEFDIFNKKSAFDFPELVEIMNILRGEDGCPWDKEQDHLTIRKNLIEETYEVCEAIDNADNELLCEELGDLLLQVVFHAKIAADEGKFDISDVITGICRKLIRRHPHIFGDTVACDSGQVLKNWDEIKKGEKNHKTASQALNSVPRQLPALMRADKLQHKAAKVGFDWENEAGALAKITEENEELVQAVASGDKNAVFEELGDLLFSVVNTARKLGIDSEEALTAASDKFSSRFQKVEELANDRKLDMKQMQLSELDLLWDEVKTIKE